MPVKALSALCFEARHGRFPIDLWQELVSHWPKTAGSRATWMLANRLARLPQGTPIELRFYVPRWLHGRLPEFSQHHGADIWRVWDAIFDALVAGGPEATTSGIGETTIGGVPVRRSHRTYMHSLNSPIGPMTACLLEVLGKAQLNQGARIPDQLGDRMERALAAPGEGGDHATIELCLRLRRLHWLDPEWTENNLIPLFALDSSKAESAWNGLASDDRLPPPETFRHIKGPFLAAFGERSGWHWDDDTGRRLSQFLVIAALWNRKGRRYITFSEARAALQASNDKMRLDALWQLNAAQSELGWAKARKFLEEAWPKEARYQSGSTSVQLADMAIDSGDNFPDAVKTVLPLLRPAERIDMFIYHARDADSPDAEPVARLFPKETLEVLDRLIASEPEMVPYDLGAVLRIVAEAQPTLRQDLRWRRLNDLLTGK
jgi:hypothetical protein